MKSDSLLLKEIVAFLILAAAGVVTAFYVFRADVTETLSDTLGNNQFAAKRALTDAEAGGNLAYELRPERNDVRFLHVGKLKSGATTSIGTPIEFLLTNQGESNDFPSIKVVFVNSSGNTVREQIFSPTDYHHADRFETEDVQLLASPNPGETGFTVQPFYAARQ